MQKNSLYILFLGVGLGLIGMVHFLLLLAPVPFPVIAIAALAAVTGAYRMLRKWERKLLLVNTVAAWPGAVLVLALLYMAVTCANYAQTTGAWDAWAIWNYAARYLDMPEHWKELFFNITNAHSDYPLNQPSVISFFWKLCGHEYNTVPFLYSLVMTLLIPALLFFELYRKGAIVAVVALLMVACNVFYLDKGAWQYADTTTAFYFLCILVCMQQARRERSTSWMALGAFMMACCIWTKNEGILMVIVTALFYSRDILKKENRVPFFLTLFIALIPWLILKFCFAPPNDLVAGQKGQSLSRIWDLGRNAIIAKYFVAKLWQEQKMLLCAFAVYCVACLVRNRLPSRQVFIILTIIAGTWLVYLLTPRSVEWHAGVTMDRMLDVWMPAMVFAILSDLFPDRKERIRGEKN